MKDEKPPNNKGQILGPDGILASAPQKAYQMADLRMGTNGTPAQLMAQGGTKSWNPQVVAVFIACAIEFDKRDQEIAGLKAKLARLETLWVETTEALDRLAAVAVVGARAEPDPEEAERDYQERLRKMHAYFAAYPSAQGPALAGAGITRQIQLRPADTGARPSLVDLRRLERWLNAHGGGEWAP